MSAQHTSGPWTFNPETGYVISPPTGYFPYGQPVAKVLGGPGKNPRENARLIAVAPELLVSLEEMLEMRDIHFTGHVHPKGERQIVADARAAVAKAKGETV